MDFVVATGSRFITDIDTVREVCYKYGMNIPESCKVFVGCANGLDGIIRSLLKVEKVYKADWSKGKSAGMTRNLRMLDDVKKMWQNYGPLRGKLLCVGFLHSGAASVGTRHCMSSAASLGYEVRQIVCHM